MKKLILIIATLTAGAQALDLSVVGTMNFESSKINVSGISANAPGTTGLGYGALVQFEMGETIALETGALIINRKYTFGPDFYAFSRLQIPAVIRFTGLPLVSFGAGPYVEFAMGDMSVETGAFKRSIPYSGRNFDTTNFGVIASVAADIQVAPLISVLADLRYNLSFTDYDNNTVPPMDRKFGGFQFLAGLKLSL